jgi:flagellar hook-basal body complex protein FliE
MHINPSTLPATLPVSDSRPAGTGDFAQAIGNAISAVENQQRTANSTAMDFLANGRGDASSVALATQRADLSLDLFQQVRNKFVSAYQEIMKMPM